MPVAAHITNEVDRGGSGMCVISAALGAGMTQGVPGLESGKDSAFWRTAKGKNAGGYGPPKLAALVRETLPDAGFASITDTTPEKLQELSQAGYVLCGTMNTG